MLSREVSTKSLAMLSMRLIETFKRWPQRLSGLLSIFQALAEPAPPSSSNWNSTIPVQFSLLALDYKTTQEIAKFTFIRTEPKPMPKPVPKIDEKPLDMSMLESVSAAVSTVSTPRYKAPEIRAPEIRLPPPFPSLPIEPKWKELRSQCTRAQFKHEYDVYCMAVDDYMNKAQTYDVYMAQNMDAHPGHPVKCLAPPEVASTYEELWEAHGMYNSNNY